jgi:hypothetical protein
VVRLFICVSAFCPAGVYELPTIPSPFRASALCLPMLCVWGFLLDSFRRLACNSESRLFHLDLIYEERKEREKKRKEEKKRKTERLAKVKLCSVLTTVPQVLVPPKRYRSKPHFRRKPNLVTALTRLHLTRRMRSFPRSRTSSPNTRRTARATGP